MSKRLWIDCETTGTKPWRHSMHQLAVIVEIDGEVKEIRDFRMRPNPKAEIDLEALKISGKTPEDIMAYPEMAVAHKELVELLRKYVDQYDKKDKFHIIGWNNNGFDNDFLRGLFKQCHDEYFGAWFWSNSLDVMVMAGEKYESVRHTLKDFKLITVAEYAGVQLDASRLHEAVYDIEITRALYYKMKET